MTVERQQQRRRHSHLTDFDAQDETNVLNV